MRGHFAPGAMVPKVLEQKLSEQNDDSKKSHFILIPSHSDVPGSGAKVRTEQLAAALTCCNFICRAQNRAVFPESQIFEGQTVTPAWSVQT
jgi:hypothetical protein